MFAGLAQKLESLDTIRDMTRKNSDSDDTAESPNSMRSVINDLNVTFTLTNAELSRSPPRPVFHAVNGNSKRQNSSNQRPSHHHHHHHHPHHHHHHHLPQPETLTPQQEELIRYIYQREYPVARQRTDGVNARATRELPLTSLG